MWVKVSEGAAERITITDLRLAHPEWSFAEAPSAESLAEFDIYPLAAVEPPEAGFGERIEEGAPVLVGEEWRQSWAVLAEPLDDLKAALWAQAKAMRDAAIDACVTVAGIGVFDSDTAARGNINGAVSMALVAQMTGQPFTIAWKLADNSVATLSGAQMIAVGVAVGQHVAACHAVAQQLGIAILAAADHAALAAIDVGAGWP